MSTPPAAGLTGLTGKVAVVTDVSDERPVDHLAAQVLEERGRRGGGAGRRSRSGGGAGPRGVGSVAARQLGSQQDIAWAAVFLAGDQAAWGSGQSWNIDGGQLTIQ